MSNDTADFVIRLARREDAAALEALITLAIPALLGPYLSPAAVQASFAIMGLDTQLIDDGTYFVVAAREEIIGCGGWSRRATLYGGDASRGRDAKLLDPRTQPARVRAMYTHPQWTRRGIGRQILQASEAAAAGEGFTRAELAATLAGEPLYVACGYEAVERFEDQAPGGVRVPLIRMAKVLVQ
jgi:GNAT superfamily N-acetyltransferase